jgi:hypothetical protein
MMWAWAALERSKSKPVAAWFGSSQHGILYQQHPALKALMPSGFDLKVKIATVEV